MFLWSNTSRPARSPHGRLFTSWIGTSYREATLRRTSAEAEKAGVTLSDADVDGNWESFLAEVEAVQLEQMALLRSLANPHGLKQVFLEGISEDEMPGFKNLLGHLSRWKKPEGNMARSMSF